MHFIVELFKNPFFDQGSEELSQLHLFGFEHFCLIGATVIIALCIFYFKDKLYKISEKTKRIFCRCVAVFMFLNMMIFYSVFIARGEYDWHLHLPLHLCFLTNFAFMYTLITQNKKLFRIVYFFTWIGPLPSMIFPNTEMRFDRFQTWNFAISHHFMFLMGLFCLCAMGWKVAASDGIRAFLIGNIIFCAVFIFNMICGTNYIMTGNLPGHIVELMPFLKYINFPIFWLEICGAIGIAASCIPLKILSGKKFVPIPQKIRQ